MRGDDFDQEMKRIEKVYEEASKHYQVAAGYRVLAAASCREVAKLRLNSLLERSASSRGRR